MAAAAADMVYKRPMPRRADRARWGREARTALGALWPLVRDGQRYSSDVLSRHFEAHRLRSPALRGAIAEGLHALLRARRRLGLALTLAGALPDPEAPFEAEDGLLALEVLAATITPDEAAARRPGPRWEQLLGLEAHLAAEPDPTRRFGLRHSLPDDLAAALLAEHGEAAEALATALNQPPPVTLRANPLLAPRDEVAARLAAEGLHTQPTAHAALGLTLRARGEVFGTAAFRDGLFEVQDEGSQLIAELVAPPPGALVVDGCAGAGGKTLALAALMGGRGRVVATDSAPAKLEELRRRARRAGASNVQAVELEAEGALSAPLSALVGKADRVLLDVPCSGFGALRRHPEARWRRSLAELEALTAVQDALLERFLPLVRPGGRLIYATCTVLRRENRDRVEALLARRPELELVRAAEIWGKAKAAPLTDPSGTFLELAPHRQGTDGFFAAVLRRAR